MKKNKEKNESVPEITSIISPTGDVLNNLVYEPIGHFKYVWKSSEGNVGISQALFFENENKWAIKLNEKWYEFKELPLNKTFFLTIPEEDIQKWISGKYKSKKGSELYQKIKNQIKIFIELPEESYYDTLVVSIFQSWLSPVLPAIFYLGVTGGYGCGKTALLEVIEKLLYHGFLCGNISKAAIPRIIQEQKLSILIDEVDVSKSDDDNELYLILRQGYRRNSSYLRVNPKSMKAETFDVFGFKVFSYHGDIEAALKSRTLQINIAEAEDARLPVISLFKDRICGLYRELFFFYLDNILSLKKSVALLPDVAEVANIPDGSTEQLREQLYDEAIKNFSQKEVEFLQSFKGRNTELCFINIIISRIVGLELLSSIKRSFDIKREENDSDEYSISSKIKKELICRKNACPINAYINGWSWCTYSEVFESINQENKVLGQKSISPQELNKYLKNFGFIQGINKKKIRFEDKIFLALIFDQHVCKKLESDPVPIEGNIGNNEQQGNKINFKETILRKIQLLDDGPGVDETKIIEEVKKQLPDCDVQEVLKLLSLEGMIYSIKPSIWKIVEK